MFVILSWSDWDDIAVVTKKDGTTKLFSTGTEATRYAARHLNFKWLIINLEG
jgi:hypothetical protein